jgi:hypothetical protein
VLLPRLTLNFLAIGKMGLDGALLPIAADHKSDLTARRSLFQHPTKLILAQDDLSVQLQDDVVELNAGFACGRVMIDTSDLHAMHILQLQHGGLFLCNIAKINAKVSLCAPAGKTHQPEQHAAMERTGLCPGGNSIQQAHACCKNQNAD